MVHLMQGGALQRAAEYYAGDLTSGEVAGATAVLAGLLATHEGASRVVSLLGGSVDHEVRGRVGERSNFKLNEVLEYTAPLDVGFGLHRATEQAFRGLAAFEPEAGWLDNLSAPLQGRRLVAQGKLPGALTAYQAVAIAERLVAADPGNAGRQHNFSVSCGKIGKVLVAQGNLPEALARDRGAAGGRCPER